MLGFVDEILAGVFFILSAGALSPAIRNQNTFLFIIAGTVAMITGAITAYDIHRVVYCDVMEGTWKCKNTQLAETETILFEEPQEAPAPKPKPSSEPAPQPSGGARTLRVDAFAPSSQYRTIQSAIDAAKAGDRVIIASGVYRENLRVKRPISIKAEEACGVTVEGSGDKQVLIWTSSGGEVEDIRFLQKEAESSLGVSIQSGSVRLKNVRATSKAGAGLFISGSSTRVQVAQARADGYCTGEPVCAFEGSKYSGIFVYDGADVSIRGVSICRNEYHGIAGRGDKTSAHLRDTRIQGNIWIGVRSRDGASMVVEGGAITGNGSDGVRVDYVEEEALGAKIEVRGVDLTNNDGFGVAIQEKGAARLTDVDLTGNGKGSLFAHEEAGEITETRVRKDP